MDSESDVQEFQGFSLNTVFASLTHVNAVTLLSFKR